LVTTSLVVVSLLVIRKVLQFHNKQSARTTKKTVQLLSQVSLNKLTLKTQGGAKCSKTQHAVSFDPLMLKMWSKDQFHQFRRCDQRINSTSLGFADFKYDVIFNEISSEKYLKPL